MNWEFHAATTLDTQKLIKDSATLMAEGIEDWLSTHVEPKEMQEESHISEFPEGFHHVPSYRFPFPTILYGARDWPSGVRHLCEADFLSIRESSGSI